MPGGGGRGGGRPHPHPTPPHPRPPPLHLTTACHLHIVFTSTNLYFYILECTRHCADDVRHPPPPGQPWVRACNVICYFTVTVQPLLSKARDESIFRMSHHHSHLHNLSIVAGTLAGALLIALSVLAGCYCRLYGTYHLFTCKQFKYSRQKE